MAKTFRRKYETATSVYRDGGVPAVVQKCRDKLLLAYSVGKKTVLIDGCRFEIRQIRDPFMRLLLLKGTYEAMERAAALQHIGRNTPLIELGGCIGVLACVTNKLLRDPRAHVVVEANPLVTPQLQRNRDANGCHFEIVNGAIAYDSDTVTFRPAFSCFATSVCGNGDVPPLTVKTTRLSRLVAERGITRFGLLCDIEGSECALVEQESGVLRNAEVMVIESHPEIVGEDRTQRMIANIQEIGFTRLHHRDGIEDPYVSVWRNTLPPVGAPP
jgi:FkbM family methyltransferase